MNKSEDILNNQYLSTGILVLIVLYSGMLSTKLTNPLLPLIKNNLVKMLLVSIIILTFNKNKPLFLMTIVALVLSMQTSKKDYTINRINDSITQNNLGNMHDILVNEQISIIVNEENCKPVNMKMSSDEIVKTAEERVENIVKENFDMIVSEENLKPENVRMTQEEIIHEAEERTKNKLNEESKKLEVQNNSNSISSLDDVKQESLIKQIILDEEIKKIVSEENSRPDNVKLTYDEIIKVAEERTENILFEKTKIPLNEIMPNDKVKEYSNVIQQENVMVHDNELSHENILKDQIDLIVSEESSKPENIKMTYEEIVQEAENRTNDIIIENTELMGKSNVKDFSNLDQQENIISQEQIKNFSDPVNSVMNEYKITQENDVNQDELINYDMVNQDTISQDILNYNMVNQEDVVVHNNMVNQEDVVAHNNMINQEHIAKHHDMARHEDVVANNDMIDQGNVVTHHNMANHEDIVAHHNMVNEETVHQEDVVTHDDMINEENINKNLPAISRIMVEEELKKKLFTSESIQTNLIENNNDLSNKNDLETKNTRVKKNIKGYDYLSPLEEQIKQNKNSNLQSKKSKKKCNLCTNMNCKQDSVEVSGYHEKNYATY